MLSREKPQFPNTVRFEDGEIDAFDSIEEICAGLEFFDSEDADGGRVEVTDGKGRRVILKVWKLEVTDLRFA
jgi:hypothetical protein